MCCKILFWKKKLHFLTNKDLKSVAREQPFAPIPAASLTRCGPTSFGVYTSSVKLWKTGWAEIGWRWSRNTDFPVAPWWTSRLVFLRPSNLGPQQTRSAFSFSYLAISFDQFPFPSWRQAGHGGWLTKGTIKTVFIHLFVFSEMADQRGEGGDVNQLLLRHWLAMRNSNSLYQPGFVRET